MAIGIGGSDWGENLFGVRDLISGIAIQLGDPGMVKFPPRWLVDRVNIAQVRVCLDLKALITINEDLTTTASQRAYNLRDDWNITDFLGLRHLRIDGYDVSPLVNGYDDLDLKTNGESNVFRGYFMESGILQLEPIPSDALSVYLAYLRRPTYLRLDTNESLELGPEYVPAIEAYALALCAPMGSEEYANRMAGYEQIKGDLVFMRMTADNL